MASGGHVLLEDFPGTGKTTLAKRWQSRFTPASSACNSPRTCCLRTCWAYPSSTNRTNCSHFHQGPVFTDILLADEINRASPRTQSALLEAMGETQVSVEGERRNLSDLFFVIATQNPVEFRGTYPLPKPKWTGLRCNSRLATSNQLRRWRSLPRRSTTIRWTAWKPCATLREVLALRRAVQQVRFSEELKRYVVDLVGGTRSATVCKLGASPRAFHRPYESVPSFGTVRWTGFRHARADQELAVPVVAHRLVMEPQARFSGLTPRGWLMSC